MPVNLSIKNVPDVLAERLRARAALNHRSIQGELMAILEDALASGERLDPHAVLARVRAMKLSTGDEATRMIRADRDATIRADESLREALDKTAAIRGKTVSQLVREILEEALADRPLQSRAGHLKGRLRLPRKTSEAWKKRLRERNWRS